MSSISQIVRDYVESHPFIIEGMSRGIISNPGLAEELQPIIESKTRKKVKLGAIIMALRRYSEVNNKKAINNKKKILANISIKSNVFAVSYKKSETITKGLIKINNIIDKYSGDIVNISQGIHSITIISDEFNKKEILAALEKEKLIFHKHNLVIITIMFSEEYLETNGILYTVTRRLAWDDINIVEIVSSYKELSIIVDKKDSERAFNSLNKILK